MTPPLLLIFGVPGGSRKSEPPGVTIPDRLRRCCRGRRCKLVINASEETRNAWAEQHQNGNNRYGDKRDQKTVFNHGLTAFILD